MPRRGPGDVVRTLSLALVCGGAVGNLIDRIRSAHGVVDFIDIGFGDSRWPTFNIADMAVSIGAFLLAWVLWGEDTPSHRGCSRPPPRRGGDRAARALVDSTRASHEFVSQERPRVLDRGGRRHRARRRHQVARRRATSTPHSRTTIIGDVVRFTLAFNPGAAFSMSLGPILALHLRRVRGRRAGHSLAAVSRRRDAGRYRACARARAGVGRRGRQPHRSVPLATRASSTSSTSALGDVRFWTFNVADSAVTVGALLLAFVLWREDRRALATPPPTRRRASDADRTAVELTRDRRRASEPG